MPDIDTDFDDDGRGKVLRWVMDKYGEENCAHIITYGSMATKNSIADVARVERLPLERANMLKKAIPDRLPDNKKMNLTNAIEYTPELREAEVSTDPRERNTIKYAKQLEGTVRGTGIHACGFIICLSLIHISTQSLHSSKVSPWSKWSTISGWAQPNSLAYSTAPSAM